MKLLGTGWRRDIRQHGVWLTVRYRLILILAGDMPVVLNMGIGSGPDCNGPLLSLVGAKTGLIDRCRLERGRDPELPIAWWLGKEGSQ